jgi:adenylate kinase
MKRVILITGAPCIGKTTVAKALAEKLSAEYINIADFAESNSLKLDKDQERCIIADEEALQQKIAEAIDFSNQTNIVLDGQYVNVVPPAQYIAHVFVLRRNPKELKVLMEKSGYTGARLSMGLQSEIIGLCLGEAVEVHAGRVCELDVTAKPVEEIVEAIVAVLEKRQTCFVGVVDWMGTLESEGILTDYVTI